MAVGAQHAAQADFTLDALPRVARATVRCARLDHIGRVYDLPTMGATLSARVNVRVLEGGRVSRVAALRASEDGLVSVSDCPRAVHVSSIGMDRHAHKWKSPIRRSGDLGRLWAHY